EYTQAIELDSGDLVSLTNRGEILLQHGLLEEARADLRKAVELDPEEKDKFANRARVLLHHMEETGKEGEKKDKET
ncbi:MAG TPA: tetratricopeptide repeat protein, partial [bacterium]|nr:tetratricopeptide repeat protein [bacterium]